MSRIIWKKLNGNLETVADINGDKIEADSDAQIPRDDQSVSTQQYTTISS